MTRSDDHDPVPDLVLRPATPADLPAVAEVLVTTREAAVPAMPPLVHGPDDVRRWVLGWDLDERGRDLWVAEADDGVVGFAEVKGDWLDDLYVVPAWAGRGVGTALLEVARTLRPDGFCLWVFVSNEPARAFYRRRGLVELEQTDGSGNEERSPDVRMAWPGRAPEVFWRRLLAEVEREQADLAARREALERAVGAART